MKLTPIPIDRFQNLQDVNFPTYQHTLHLFTDASVPSGSDQGSYACLAVGHRKGERYAFIGSGHGEADNVRLEIIGIIWAIKAAAERYRDGAWAHLNTVKVFTDLKIARTPLPDQCAEWKNGELWRYLLETLEDAPFRVRILWVKGHGNCAGNNFVDQLAKKHRPVP